LNEDFAFRDKRGKGTKWELRKYASKKMDKGFLTQLDSSELIDIVIITIGYNCINAFLLNEVYTKEHPIGSAEHHPSPYHQK
jgi:hypothetical protein